MANVSKLFSTNVFNDSVMRERLPKETYRALKKSTEEGCPLSIETANVVANAMKDWAIERGVTHFTHWFQPMTGITAEKHDSFISPDKNGQVIMEFSGKELIKGEPDASSFPSGGLRATFEARGYTAWDPTSFAFIKDGTLCIPTAFCSYGGEALDKKTPLLKSMELLSKEAVKIVKLFGHDDVKKVVTTVGPEQEYFLIDKSMYAQRKDLKFCGRTLYGAKAPKGQELEDHYFGTIRPRVSTFMKELDEELWKLGILAKTKHNEVAPSQHELAPIFTTTNIATDHNQLTMETMKKVAESHGLVCLLHEKPFDGVNGSGKHNNWSLSTDTGINLLDPGKHPKDNKSFLLFLCAIIKGVDEYQDLMRISVASAGNDHRLGANEAPPAIISIFLGDELSEVLSSIETGIDFDDTKNTKMDMGVDVLPSFHKDTTDRNRTSPFAFTGNKFEFRMLGSALSIACPNLMLNTIVADVLSKFYDRLSKSNDFDSELKDLLQETVKKHKRILFDGNNYSEEWVEEANKRGLLNLRSTPEALPYYIKDKNIELFTRNNIFTRAEMLSRYEIQLEGFAKVINIEALTALDMARQDILPAVIKFVDKLTKTILNKKRLNENYACKAESKLVDKLSGLCDDMFDKCDTLEQAIASAQALTDPLETAQFYQNTVLPAMSDLRATADEMEKDTASEYWPYPTYGDMLFSV